MVHLHSFLLKFIWSVTFVSHRCNLFSRHSVSKLFFVVLKNLVAYHAWFCGFTHHAVEYLASSKMWDEELKRHVFILFYVELIWCQLFKKVINRPCYILLNFWIFGGRWTTLNNANELSKFNFRWSIFVYEIYNFLNLSPIVNKSKCYQRIFELVHSYRAWTIVI